ncbi:hypothetical protein [Eubacterium ventriosum]|jgi:hypothetical protein|nr:hypothetical protein [Eubacterium ventriosum]
MLLEEDMKGADMKKNKNLILSSFFMFAISLACLITESYAWFSMTGSVEVTGPEFKASAPENLQISNDGNTWASSITVDLYKKDDFKISPASSYTGIDNNIFYTEDINDGGSAKNTNFKVAVTGASKGNEGYYLDVPLWIRTTGDSEVKVAVDVNDTSVTYAKDLDEDGNVSDTQEISKAVRIAFLDTSKDKNALGDNNKPLVYNANPGFVGKVIGNINEDGTGNRVDSSYLTNNTQMLQVPAYSATQTKGAPFVARIWIEGEDPNCVFANGGKSFAISLKFIAIDDNTNN